MIFNRCFGCMNELPEEGPCPWCGYDPAKEEFIPHQLRPGTILRGTFVTGKTLGQGGFGITYLGWDINLETRVAIKEYFPWGIVSRNTTVSSSVMGTSGAQGENFLRGRDRFVREARALARFAGDPGIVQVKDFFLENNTAYIVMEYLNGITLKDYVAKQGGRLSVSEVFRLMQPIIRSLDRIHREGLVHRDISPDNLMLLPDGRLKLLDFGAVNEVSDEEHSKTVLLKYGYTPAEQYQRRGNLGAWTDIYALCATMYFCLTGIVPQDALERMEDDLLDLPLEVESQMTESQRKTLMKGLESSYRNRCQSMEELYQGFYQSESEPAPQDQTLDIEPVSVPAQDDPEPVPSPSSEAEQPASLAPEQEWEMSPEPVPEAGQRQDDYEDEYVQNEDLEKKEHISSWIMNPAVAILIAVAVQLVVLMLTSVSGLSVSPKEIVFGIPVTMLVLLLLFRVLPGGSGRRRICFMLGVPVAVLVLFKSPLLLDNGSRTGGDHVSSSGMGMTAHPSDPEKQGEESENTAAPYQAACMDLFEDFLDDTKVLGRDFRKANMSTYMTSLSKKGFWFWSGTDYVRQKCSNEGDDGWKTFLAAKNDLWTAQTSPKELVEAEGFILFAKNESATRLCWNAYYPWIFDEISEQFPSPLDIQIGDDIDTVTRKLSSNGKMEWENMIAWLEEGDEKIDSEKNSRMVEQNWIDSTGKNWSFAGYYEKDEYGEDVSYHIFRDKSMITLYFRNNEDILYLYSVDVSDEGDVH